MITIANVVDAGWNERMVGTPVQFKTPLGTVDESNLQTYVSILEAELLKMRSKSNEDAPDNNDIEFLLGRKFEARIHEIGKDLGQEFEATKDFVKRVFEGMPKHVVPGGVDSYDVEKPDQVVTMAKLHPEDAMGVNLERTIMQTADRSGGVPDITK